VTKVTVMTAMRYHIPAAICMQQLPATVETTQQQPSNDKAENYPNMILTTQSIVHVQQSGEQLDDCMLIQQSKHRTPITTFLQLHLPSSTFHDTVAPLAAHA